MSGFTKLVPEILQSSVWNYDAEVRCVWIAMLASKDEHGNVRGTRLSMARTANVPAEAVDRALDLFTSPDPDSNTPDNDGRRVEAVSGGWHVINHDVYRARDYRDVEAEKKRIQRARKRQEVPDLSGTCPGLVPDPSVSVSASVSVSDEGGCKGEGESAEPPTPEPPPSKRFVRPGVEAVAAYIAEIGAAIDPQAFCDHYTSNGWRIGGKTAMKDWRAAVRNWERMRKKETAKEGRSNLINTWHDPNPDMTMRNAF